MEKIEITVSGGKIIQVSPDDIDGSRMNYFGNADIKLNDGTVYHTHIKHNYFVNMMKKIYEKNS
ncbi:hypothetical protein [Pasteurella canis]|uniref:hypothetical protein n=1 Tax=Pasteurella canis TaxID=753 RepID=UPI001322B767|nr:hypothetical protein [Pasteurella canis]MXN88561.1 hypothetical protein [Pasteurella canis]